MKPKTTTSHWMICAAFVCVLAGWPAKSFAQETPVTNVVTITTFDYDFDAGIAHNLRWSYPYHYQGPAPEPVGWSHFFSNNYYDPEDTLFTNAMGQFAFDNTVYGDYMTNNPGSYYGFGCGGALNWTNDSSILVSTNREDYILSFDVRAEGLKAGLTSVGGEFQIRFEAPDDTLSPPDGNTDFDNLMQVNFNFNASSNWQRYVFTLDQGSIGNGSLENFILHKDMCNGQGFGINYHQPEGGWDYDADNNLYFDNILLEVVQHVGAPPPPPKVASGTIIDWNLDDKALWWGAGGWSWAEPPCPAPTGTYAFGTNVAGDVGAPNSYGVGGSSGWVFWMTNTAMSGYTPGWWGIGWNGGGPTDSALWTSADLEDYRLTFDTRVEGLAEGTAAVNFALHFSLRAPDDTIQPPDEDTDSDLVLQLAFSVPAGTNWQTVSYTFKQGQIEGGTSKANFASYFSKINEPMPEWQIANQPLVNWGFDEDNVVVVDNFKLERLVVACPPLSVGTSGDNVVVTWTAPSTGSVKLESAASVNGPYSEVVGASNPYSTPILGAPRYFRTVWVPPTP